MLVILLFAGPSFLVDPIGCRQLAFPTKHIVAGRGVEMMGYPIYDKANFGNNYSLHYTYIFNTFVFMQVFNFFNGRILNDSINIFQRIRDSEYLKYLIMIIIFFQVILLTFTGPAIRVAMWGLDPVGWIISIAIGATIIPYMTIVKLAKTSEIFKKWMRGYGNKQLSLQDLNRTNTISIRRGHSKKVLGYQPKLTHKTSTVEEYLKEVK